MNASLLDQSRRRYLRIATWLTAALHVAGLLLVAWTSLHKEPAVVATSTSTSAFATVTAGALGGDARIVQSLRMDQNNLVRIDVLTRHGERSPDSPIVASLREPNGADVAEVTIEPSSIPDDARMPVIFPVVARSAGNTYHLMLEQPGATSRDGVSVAGVGCDCFVGGELLSSAPRPGRVSASPDEEAASASGEAQDLVMTVYFLPPPGVLSKMRILAERIDVYKPGWLDARWIAVFAILSAAAYGAFIHAVLRSATSFLQARAAMLVLAGSLIVGVVAPLMFVRTT